MSKKTVYSNIAIDLGGKYTGCVSYTSSILPSADDINAFIIEMPDDGKGIKYTVKDRTQKRHMIRALDRFKKARKLIYLVISSVIHRELTADEKEAISSLMKRRGYTRLEAEIDLDILKECPVDLFASYIKDLFDESQSLYDQFNQRCCDLDSAKVMMKELSQDEFNKAVESSELDKTEIELYKSAFDVMVKAAENIINTCEFGNKHRKQYLSDIKADINKDSRLADIVKSFDGNEKLFKCVGNISNLQLRALRWYFNDINMKGNPKWIPERFKKVWARAYKYFHYPKEDQQKARELIKNLEISNDVTSLLCSIDPLDTIPPYEDQNNRNLPTDLTLLLSPKALDKKYTNLWEKWAEKFAKLYPNLKYQLEDIVKISDRKSRIDVKSSSSYTQSKVFNSYVMQRLFDLAADKNEPITLLRSWVRDPSNSKLADTVKIIQSVVEDREDDFYKLAQSYYNEVEMAKSGLWSVIDDPLLEISEIHPPMKNKVISTLVGNVLGINNDFDYEKFLEVWRAPIKGRKTLKSICKDIEGLRKEYGNTFKIEYDYANYSAKEKKERLTADQKKLVEINKIIEEISPLVRNSISQDPLSEIKFNNPFSFSQLYTLIETDTLGFSSNCVAVNMENNARMQFLLGNHALCSRLPTESVRPFDGALGKILERQAYEIAKVKSAEIKELDSLNETVINVGILIEQNKFEFTESIAKIKKSKLLEKIKKRSQSGVSRQLKKWENKEKRIKSASRGVCPYTGERISETNGEIDHIIPRSFTKSSMGTIFNSEANLIFCRLTGNRNKDENMYTLRELSPKYLNAVFGTADIVQIQQNIEGTVAKISSKNPRFLFDMMDQKEQDCCRHALFMPHSKAYQIVVSAMARSYSTRVNGTQSYFVNAIISKLKNELSSWLKTHNSTLNFFAYKVDPSDVHSTRDDLSKLNALLKKQENQPITSHAIDALCVLASASTNERISENISKESCLAKISNTGNLLKLEPHEFKILRIEKKDFSDKNDDFSRKLFNDTIYAEHFLPVMVMKDQVKIGFSWNSSKEGNSIEIVKDQHKFLELLAPFFNKAIESSCKFITYKINKKKAFDFIHRYIHQEVDVNDCALIVKILESLRYTTVNTDVCDIYNDREKRFKNKSEILTNKNFELNFSLPKPFKILACKKIYLPSKNEWSKITEKFSDYLGKDNIKNGKEIIYNSLNLNKKNTKKLNHAGTKRVYSLPILKNASGGIRIKRYTDEMEEFYQLLEVNTPQTVKRKGFALSEKGEVMWNKPITVDSYIGKNLTLLEKNYKNVCFGDNFVPMKENRMVYKNEKTEVYISPSSDSRRLVIIKQPFDEFNKCLKNKYKNYLELPSTLVLSGDEIKNYVKNMKNDFIGNPRVETKNNKKTGKIVMLSIGKLVRYCYMSTTCDSLMKTAYDCALS